MRHLWSLLAGVVVAPLTWALVTLGQDGSSRTIDRWAEVGTFNVANLIEPAVYLGVAGILLGLLGTLRISPFGPLTAGLLLIAPYAGMFVAPLGVRNRVPDDWKAIGDPLPLRLPLENGTLFMIGVLLLMATFSVQRWRRWPQPAATGMAMESVSDDTRALTDWPPKGDSAGADTSPVIPLGSTDPVSAGLPKRGGGSPWSAPPRASATRETVAK